MQRKQVAKFIRIAIYVVLVVGIPLGIYEATPVPGALLARTIIDSFNNVETPPNYPAIASSISITRDVTVSVKNAPETSIDIYTPKQSSVPRPIILWLHGGAFVGGNKAQTQIYSTMLASKGYTVASLEYTRPPDARYPVPIQQANAALSFLRSNAHSYDSDPTRFFVAGNSAGAQLASQVAAVETNPRLAAAMHIDQALTAGTLKGAVLYCGAYDMATLQKIRSPFFHVAIWSYTGYRNWMDFPDINQLSTVQQVTSNYPSVFLTGGDADSLTPQSHELANVLREHHVAVTTQFWEGSGAKLGHDYQFELSKPQAQETFKNAIKFLDEQSKGN